MRARILDLAFLVGILAKAIDGLIEIIAGLALLWVSPAQLNWVAHRVTAEELSEDPNDLIANLILHGTTHLRGETIVFIAAYLLVHGVVKLAIIGAIAVGSLRLYPWAIAALAAFLGFQVYELVVHPGVGVAVLVVLDAVIVWLTWREWRHGQTLKSVLARTLGWFWRRDDS